MCVLLNMDEGPHERLKYKKSGLKRRFVVRLNRKRDPSIREVRQAFA